VKKLSILLVLLVVMLTACGTSATKPEDMNDANVEVTTQDMEVATQMAGFFYNLQTIGKYYDDGMTAMVSAGVGTTILAWDSSVGKYAALLTQPIVPWSTEVVVEILRNKNLATRFQILVEIAASQPNIQQKNVARRFNLTPQAVSDYIK